MTGRIIMRGAAPPTYSRWRHGGWYVTNVRYPSGACGCVSRNYKDGKWRVVCDPRPFEQRPTFKSRDDAAAAELLLAAFAPVRNRAEAWDKRLQRAQRGLRRQRIDQQLAAAIIRRGRAALADIAEEQRRTWAVQADQARGEREAMAG